jgi:hypothetical protein
MAFEFSVFVRRTLCLLALATVGCGEGSELALTVPSTLSNAPTIMVTGGANQVGEVGDRLPEAVTVRVTDRARGGAPLAGQLLLWIISNGAGHLDQDTTRTDVAGYSRQSWTLGTHAMVDSLDVWLLAPSGEATTRVSVGAVALHGPPIIGAEKCNPIEFALTAGVAVPIVDSVRVYSRDQYNNIWPVSLGISVKDVRFSGRVSGTGPVPAFTASTITLPPSSKSYDPQTGSWEGAWVVTFSIQGPNDGGCSIGAAAR